MYINTEMRMLEMLKLKLELRASLANAHTLKPNVFLNSLDSLAWKVSENAIVTDFGLLCVEMNAKMLFLVVVLGTQLATTAHVKDLNFHVDLLAILMMIQVYALVNKLLFQLLHLLCLLLLIHQLHQLSQQLAHHLHLLK